MMTPELEALSLDDVPLAFLDVETTGLYPQYGDRVCEIAIVRSRVDLVQATYQSLVNPQRSISPDAARVNHLSDRDVCDAPRFAAVADQVLFMLRDAVVVCHNAPFDLSFVASEMQRCGRALDVPIVLDTLALARRCFSFAHNGLAHVASVLKIPTPDAHRALGDAMTTRQVYLSFVQSLWTSGVRTLGDILRVQGGSVPVPPTTEIALPPGVSEALASGKRLFLRYVDGQGEVSERWVTPEQVTGVGGTMALVAFCHMRQEKRQFRLDRIIEVRIEP